MPESQTRARSSDLAAGSAGRLAIRSERRGSVHVIAVSGELDVAAYGALEHELRRAEATDAEQITLDLSGLDFIDSNGLRVIIAAHARSLADGDRLRLLRGPAHVQRIFEITATSDRLPFSD